MQRLRTDEDQPMLCAGFRKIRALRQKTVSRMDGIGSGAQGRLDNLRNVQITLRCLSRADAQDPVRHLCGQAFPVRFRNGRNGFDPELLTGTDHANGDFPAVGHQNAVNFSPAYLVSSDSCPFDSKDRLFEFYQLTILSKKFRDLTLYACRDAIPLIQNVDEAYAIVCLNPLADLYERTISRFCRPEEDPQPWRQDGLPGLLFNIFSRVYIGFSFLFCIAFSNPTSGIPCGDATNPDGTDSSIRSGTGHQKILAIPMIYPHSMLRAIFSTREKSFS